MMLQLIALVVVTLTLHLTLHCTGVRVGVGVGVVDGCEAGCRCKAEGILWTADCSDLGLTDTPSNINVLTTYLDLSMNDFSTLPTGSFSRFQALRELHLDANSLSTVPRGSFKGLRSLRYLWMDDNRLTQVPVAALASLPGLQALTLALNHISHLPDRAFHALRHLLVLHLHNNQIGSLAERCFEGLHNLETLDMSSNTLDSFPTVIRALPSLRDLNLHNNNIKTIPQHAFIGNPSLETINLHNNPVQSIGKTSFQKLPQLLTLSLSGTTSITRFPDLTGTSSVKSLAITGTHISELPSTLCEDLPLLRQLDLSHNRILSLPCFTDCRNIQKIDLRYNSIHVIQTGTFWKMRELSTLDLSFNRLSHLPLGEELSGLTCLSLAGNQELRDPLPPYLLPRFRIAEMLFGFQCSVLPCVRPGKPYPMCPCRTENGNCVLRERTDPESRPAQYHGMESRTQPAHHPVPPGLLLQISLRSSPPWMAHFCVWAIFIPSIALNCLVLTLVFLPSALCRTTAAQRLLLAALFSLRLLTGLCGTGLALAEDIQSSLQAPCWGGKAAQCRGSLGELVFLLSSQACVVVLMMAVVWEHRNPRAPREPSTWSATPGVQRLVGAASSVLVAVVLCCNAVLVLIASMRVVRDESSLKGSIRTGQMRWELNAARVALDCGGYLLLTAIHVLFFYGRQRDRNTITQYPRPVLFTTHAVTCVLLANTVLSAAEALLWLNEGSSIMCSAAPILQPAGGSPSLLLSALPAVLDPLLYSLLHLHHGVDQRVGRPGDRKH
ncbi:unnamed protein product [Lota lota]